MSYDINALKAALEEYRHASANPEAAFEVADELTKAVKSGLLDDAALGRRVTAGDEALVEAMARALCKADGYSWADDELYQRLARAALAALKEAK